MRVSPVVAAARTAGAEIGNEVALLAKTDGCKLLAQ